MYLISHIFTETASLSVDYFQGKKIATYKNNKNILYTITTIYIKHEMLCWIVKDRESPEVHSNNNYSNIFLHYYSDTQPLKWPSVSISAMLPQLGP